MIKYQGGRVGMGAKIPPKWVPPVDRMIFISPTCILTGREALAGREGRGGWTAKKVPKIVCSKIHKTNCSDFNKLNPRI